MTDSALAGVFDGVRVLEVGQYVAAPVAAELLAHGGADVIKVEPVDGDVTRFTDPLPDVGDPSRADGRHYVIKARGKRAIPIDLGTDEGRALAIRLAADSDVFITNMRPGGAERMGLGYDALRADHPELIYGEISGFGDIGPNAGRPSIDIIAQAWTGLRAAGGIDDDGLPGYYEPFYCDYVAGLLLAFGIAGALRHREITGEGQRVATSLAHAGLYVQHRSANLFESVDGWKHDLVEQRQTGAPLADLHAIRGPRLSPHLYYMTTYSTADGAVTVGAAGPLAPRFTDTFGVADPRRDPCWADRDERGRLLDEATTAMAAVFAELTTDEAMRRLTQVGIPATPIRLLEELLVDPDAHAAGLVYEATHPRVGTFTMPGAPLTMSGTDYSPKATIAEFGEHTDEILHRLGYDPDTIERLIADGIVRRADP